MNRMRKNLPHYAKGQEEIKLFKASGKNAARPVQASPVCGRRLHEKERCRPQIADGTVRIFMIKNRRTGVRRKINYAFVWEADLMV